MIPEDKVAEIRERTDVLALIGDYVQLKRVGSSHRGLCPFHAEKSPSFYVHPQRQFFHCFGCRASGDAIAFLMKIEGHSFVEALRMLAERAGIELPTETQTRDPQAEREKAHRDRLYALLDLAAGFYLQQLSKHPHADIARAEIAKRHVEPKTAETYRLGYAPAGWDALATYLRERGASLTDAEEVGLVGKRNNGNGHYDRFRHRLMFPVADVHGRIVAFSGRALAPLPNEPVTDRVEAKYINSPESPIYTKGDLLFGLYEARVEVRREGWALLCEGNFDVLALHQAGLKNVCAPLGTAFTEAQARLLRRFAQRVTVIFDGDSAGKKAVVAAYPLLAKAGFAGRVVTLPAGMDPDQMARERGPEAIRQLIDSSPGIVEALIDNAAADAGGSAAERATVIEQLGPMLALVESPVERQLYVERVARRFGIQDVEVVRAQLRRGLGDRRSRPAAPAVAKTSVPSSPERVNLPPLESELIGALLDQPELFAAAESEGAQELLTSPELQFIFRAAVGVVQKRGVLDAGMLLSHMDEGPGRRWLEERLSVEKYDLQSARDTLEKGLSRLKNENTQRQRQQLSKQILEALRTGDQQHAQALTKLRDELAQSAIRQGPKG